MDMWLYPLIILAGFLTGFINTLAGAGSAVSLALMSFVGLPLDVANGTNRVAILMQNMVGVNRFHAQKMMDWRMGLWLALPAAAGSIVGAWLASVMSAKNLETAIGVLMLVILVMLFVRPKRWLEGQPDMHGTRPTPSQFAIFFAIGIYGGFIQMGVGIFLLSGLVLGAGYDLVRANAVKVLIVLSFTIFALAIFIWSDLVRWDIGLILGVGNMLGAWAATKQAAKRGAPFVRWLLIVIVAYAALKYLGGFSAGLDLLR